MMTDAQVDKILKDIVIICDSREQKNNHILDYFNEHGIKYFEDKMETADYTFYLPNYPHLGLDRSILIERKNSWDEIIGNFTKHRKRFVAEFERLNCEDMHIMIETATWRKLINGSYRSKVPPQSIMASIMTFSFRYNTKIWFTQPSDSGYVILSLIHYGLREKLKNM